MEPRPVPLRVLVTGGSGFIGQALVEALMTAGCSVIATTRDPDCASSRGMADWVRWHAGDTLPCLPGRDVVVHLANVAHLGDDESLSHLADARAVNVAATCALAQAAQAASVRHFIYLSSAKVFGVSQAAGGTGLTESLQPEPDDAYGALKRDAERELCQMQNSSMAVSIVRPPLVVGPGARGNLERLMRAIVAKQWLPLGAVRNQRSLVARRDLVAALVALCRCEAPPGGVFHVADPATCSTVEIIEVLAEALQCQARLLPVPVVVLRAVGAVAGRRADVQRLTGSFVLDSGRMQQLLNWEPAQPARLALAEMAAAFADSRPLPAVSRQPPVAR